MSKRKKTMSVLPVRNLFDFSPFELFKGLRTDLYVEFESETDNIIAMTWKEVILQRYLLELLTKDIYNGIHRISLATIPITTDLCLCKYYTEGVFTSSTITKYLEQLFKLIVRKLNTHNPPLPRNMLDIFFRNAVIMYNTIYNDIIYSITEYVATSRLSDFVEIQNNEELLNSMLAIREAIPEKKNEAIANSYSVLDRILREDKRYEHNNVRLGYVSGNTNARQVKQLLGPRGFITELDGTIFKYPVCTSFTLGLNDLYDIAIESRAGAKALYTSNKAVQQSEYLARGLQLVTMILEKLEDGDCGSKYYLDWYVRPASDQNKSDLNNLLGKWFLNPKTNKEEIITKDHKWLEGKTIKLRSILKCTCKDKSHVCMKCFGELGYSVPSHANLGHFCSVELSEKITQSILSTKHEMSSAKANEVRLNDVTKKYLYVKGNDYYFNEGLLNNKSVVKYYFVINQKEAFGIKDLSNTTKINTIDPLRVSRIESIGLLKMQDDKVLEYEILPIKDVNRHGSFTHKFIEYILSCDWYLNEKDEYVIPLNKWNIKQPMINLLDLEYSFKALNDDVSRLFRKIKQKKGMGSLDSPELLLQKLFNIVNFKLDVNISLLEGIIYAFVIRDFATDDCHIGGYTKDGEPENRSLRQLHDTVSGRSLGAAYGWERVVNLIKSPKSFGGANAVDHPMDVTIKPDHVVRKVNMERMKTNVQSK